MRLALTLLPLLPLIIRPTIHLTRRPWKLFFLRQSRNGTLYHECMNELDLSPFLSVFLLFSLSPNWIAGIH